MSKKIPSYPKVWALGHPSVAELMLDSVIVEEKVDGSQFSFGIVDGELCARSKGQEIILDRPEGMFELAVETVKRLAPHLRQGFIYRCEYLMKPKHNTVAYARAPKNNLVLLDVQTGPETYLGVDDKAAEAQRLEIDVVPILHRDFELTTDNAEEPLKLLERESFLGGAKIEGIVIKNYKRFGKDGKALMGKYVSEAFKEQHTVEWKKTSPQKNDVMVDLLKAINSEVRWEKAFQHMRDSGKLESSPRDIPILLDEAVKDGQTELEPWVKEQLFKWALPQLRRKLVKGLPEWYKKKLMEKQMSTMPHDHLPEGSS